MAKIIATTPSSTSTTHYYTFTVPNFKEFKGVSVNTGRVSVESIVGNTIKVKCTGGSYYTSSYGGGSYEPSHSKYVSIPGCTVTYSEWWEWGGGNSGWWYDYLYYGNCSSSSYRYSYNSDGYSGQLSCDYQYELYDRDLPYTLPKNPSDGTKVYIREAANYYNYGGTVTRPGYDTTWYNYYYRYVITLEYEERGVEMTLKINDQLKKADEAWIKIDGELKSIDTLNMNINGALKEGV